MGVLKFPSSLLYVSEIPEINRQKISMKNYKKSFMHISKFFYCDDINILCINA